MNRLLIVLAAASFLSYTYAIRRIFSRASGVDRRMKLLQTIGSISAIIHLLCLWNARFLSISQLLGSVALYAMGLCLFNAARSALHGYALTLAFSSDSPSLLIQSGVYRYIRHPFYAAYALTWLAGIVAAPSLWTMTTTLVMCLGYWWAANWEESKFRNSALATEYAAYRTRSGLFWPRVFR